MYSINAVTKQGRFWRPSIVSHLELYHWLKQGLQTTARGPNLAREDISLIMKKLYNYEKFVDLLGFNTSRNNHIT